jgi:competence ComEA-like helix-hairpin-helix protein
MSFVAEIVTDIAYRTDSLKLILLSLGILFFVACRSSGSTTNNNSASPKKQSEFGSKYEQAATGSCLNINTATYDELIELPGIGEVMAKRILEYRTRQGPFRRPEEIIIVEGFSERRYRAIARMICVE